MDRRRMQTAAKLLEKAQSTEFEAEAIALLDKSCRLLAGVITSVDMQVEPTACDSPRRERRRVPDRRPHQPPTIIGTRVPTADPAITYGRPVEDFRSEGREHVDLIV